MRCMILLAFLQFFFVAGVNAYEHITCANESFCGKVVVEPEVAPKNVCESGVLRVFSDVGHSGVTCDCQCSLHEDISWFLDDEKNKIVSVSTGMLVRRNYFEEQDKFVFEAMGRTPLCFPYNKKNQPNANYLSLEKSQVNGDYCFEIFYVDLHHGVKIYSPSGGLISNERVSEFSGDSPLLTKILLSKTPSVLDSNSDENKRLMTILSACKTQCLSQDIKSFTLTNTGIASVPAASLNDYGFYLWKSGLFAESIRILKAVIDSYPERIPAYLNLADALWDNNCQAEASGNYRIYVERMARAGKESKVPSRVYDRLK